MAPPRPGVTVAILQPGYLPWLGYFDLVARADVFVVYDDVQFDRRGWRNRNRVLKDGEPHWITVPVRRTGHFDAAIRDIRLADRVWPRKHLEMLRHLYRRAPRFDWAFEIVRAYLEAPPRERLLDLCLAGHERLTAALGLDGAVRLASDLGDDDLGRTERLVALTRRVGGTRYLSGNAARAYLDVPLFADAGIDVEFQSYAPPAYPQFDHPFVSHLSVVDAMMFLGPAARALVGPDLLQDHAQRAAV